MLNLAYCRKRRVFLLICNKFCQFFSVVAIVIKRDKFELFEYVWNFFSKYSWFISGNNEY